MKKLNLGFVFICKNAVRTCKLADIFLTQKNICQYHIFDVFLQGITFL